MQKTILATFELNPEVDNHQKWEVLKAVEYNLDSRTLKWKRQGDKIVIRYVHEDWASLGGSKSCPENLLWDLSFEGMNFQSLAVEYDDALLPSSENNSNGGFLFRNGECYSYIEIYDVVIITSLPSRKRVSMFLDVSSHHSDMDTLRRGFLRVMLRFENQLCITQTALRLIQAYERDPENGGRIQRFKGELLERIAQV